ncbi:hypothetical protein [Gayadomonas joobiniege]|uniref:hypothetical protein n=1 Tax=Gayadomonas joobiniege TaxID=1234606 RepID=UPI000364B9EE|nr:hypothetical protein [Gayadomonas joobiniege]
MNRLILIIICSLLFACRSTINVPQTEQWLNFQSNQVRQNAHKINTDFPIVYARFLTLKQLAGEQQVSSLVPLADAVRHDYQSYQEIAQKQQSSRRDTERLWQGKQAISNQDQHFEKISAFKKTSKENFERLYQLQKNYLKNSQQLHKQINQTKFSRYARQLPSGLFQAKQQLSRLQAEENYLAFNRAGIQLYQQKLMQPISNFAQIIELLDVQRQVQPLKNKFTPLPNNKRHLSQSNVALAHALLKEKISSDIYKIASEFALQQKQGDKAIVNLQPIEAGPYNALTQVLSVQQQNQVNDIFAKQKQKLLVQILADNTAARSKIMTESISDRDKLTRLVLEEKKFNRYHQPILMDASVKQYLSQTQAERLSLLRAVTPNLLQEIEKAERPQTLLSLLAGLATQSDQSQPLYQDLKQTQTQKLQQLLAFKPAYSAAQLDLNSFTAEDLSFETELTALYLGDFKAARLTATGQATALLFEQYLTAFGRHCHAYLPANRVPMTVRKCSMETVGRNIYGNEVSRTCSSWVDVPTGLYADPILYQKSKHLAAGLGIKMLTNALKDPFATRNMIDDALDMKGEMDLLVQKNKCNNLGLKRFEDNFYRFVSKKSPLTLTGNYRLADLQAIYQQPLPAKNINFHHLLDDLISENARGWMLNRYEKNSVANINLLSTDPQGRANQLTAGYYFSALNKRYSGSVRLTFTQGRPNCLYFSDAPNTCRNPSRKIVNDYEKGRYLK